MARLTNTINFKNAIIDYNNNTITEVTKEEESTYVLSDILARFEDKYVSLNIKEDSEVLGE